MTKAEAMCLAAQLNIDLPKRGSADALLEMCVARGFNLGIEHATGDWVIWDKNDKVVARCE